MNEVRHGRRVPLLITEVPVSVVVLAGLFLLLLLAVYAHMRGWEAPTLLLAMAALAALLLAAAWACAVAARWGKSAQDRTGEAPAAFLPQTLKDWVSIAQGVAAVVALVGALVWFLHREEAVERVNIDHRIVHRDLDATWTWVRVESHLENVGNVPVTIGHALGTVRRIKPLEPEFRDDLAQGYSLVTEGETRVRWREIGVPHRSDPGLRLNPKESDYVVHEFIVPTALETVELYTSFRPRRESELTYRKSTVYDLD